MAGTWLAYVEAPPDQIYVTHAELRAVLGNATVRDDGVSLGCADRCRLQGRNTTTFSVKLLHILQEQLSAKVAAEDTLKSAVHETLEYTALTLLLSAFLLFCAAVCMVALWGTRRVFLAWRSWERWRSMGRAGAGGAMGMI